MARFASIEEIGAFAVAYAPVRWAEIFLKSGVPNTVVVVSSKDDPENSNYLEQARSSLFYISLIYASLGFCIFMILSTIFPSIFGRELPIGSMLAAMAFIPIASALAAVPEGILQKDLKIRALALRTLIGQSVAAVFSLVYILNGGGAWALVSFVLINAILNPIIVLIVSRWRPIFRPSLTMMRTQFPRLMAISGQGLVASLHWPVLQFSVGLGLGLEAAGAFQIAQRVYQILDSLCLAPIRFLVLPILSRTAEANEGQLKPQSVLRVLRMAGIISAPVYLGMISVAGPGLSLIIGETNSGQSANILQILCLLGFCITTGTLLGQAVTVAGRADLSLFRSFWSLIVGMMLVAPTILISLEMVTIAWATGSYLVLAVFLYRVAPVFETSAWSFFIAVGRPYLAAGLAVLPGFILARSIFQSWSDWQLLVMQIPMAGIVYLIISSIMAREAFQEMRQALKH